MKAGPRNAASLLNEIVDIEQAPLAAKILLQEIILGQGWAEDREIAAELAEAWEEKFLIKAMEIETMRLSRGQPCNFEFNSSSRYILQGTARILPGDTKKKIAEKNRRRHLADYVDVITDLSEDEFEYLCAGILSLLGVSKPVVTRKSGDQGIDFFGRLELGKFIQFSSLPGGIESQLMIWLVGQAKHYFSTPISTHVLRELFGSVELARAKIFAGKKDPHAELKIRAGDPVYYMLITSGEVSADSWEIVSRSGMILMDRSMIALTLSDKGIGMKGNIFCADDLKSWIRKFKTQ